MILLYICGALMFVGCVVAFIVERRKTPEEREWEKRKALEKTIKENSWRHEFYHGDTMIGYEEFVGAREDDIEWFYKHPGHGIYQDPKTGKVRGSKNPDGLIWYDPEEITMEIKCSTYSHSYHPTKKDQKDFKKWCEEQGIDLEAIKEESLRIRKENARRMRGIGKKKPWEEDK